MAMGPYTGWSAASGVLDLYMTHSALAYLNALATPKVTIDGYPHARPWGRHLFELPAGQHDLRVTFTYLFFDACPGRILVPIYPGHTTSVLYEAPYFRFMNGTMRIVRTVPNGPAY
jgi:hypothetical protein